MLPALIFTLATLILTYPMALQLTDHVVDKADPLLNAWILAWDAHSLTTDPGNLYNANHFYPYSNTLAYTETLLGQAMVAAPIIWLTGNPILALNSCTLLTFVTAGMTMYVLVLDLIPSKSAALVAGMIFAFNAYRFAHIVHLQLLSAQWIPLCLLFLRRLITRQKWEDALGLGVSFNLQALSSYYYALFTAVAMTSFLLIYLIVHRPTVDQRWVRKLLLLGVATALLQVPLSLPYFRVRASMEFERSLEDAIRGGADLTDFLTVPPTNHLLGRITEPLRGKDWWEHTAFPGMAAMLLVGFAYLCPHPPENRKLLTTFGSLALIGFILSLGPSLQAAERTLSTPLPYRLLYELVPGFRAIRQPARFHVITLTGLSVIAGVGASRLFARMISTRWRSFLTIAALGLIGAENLTIPVNTLQMPTADEIPSVYQWLAEQPQTGPVLELPVLMDVGAIEGPRLYYSSFHWRRLINGYGGFFPPVYAHFLFLDHEFPSQSHDWIVGLGTQYVILHRWQYSATQLRAIDASLSEFEDVFQCVADFGNDQVYRVHHPMTGKPNTPDRERSLGRQVRLLGYSIDSSVIEPGQEIELHLFWQGTDTIDRDYTVFVHVLDRHGNLVAQHDGQPQGGDRPTSAWRLEEVVSDTHVVVLPYELAPDTYRVHVGMYELQTMRRLAVYDSDGIIVSDALNLGSLQLDER